MAWREGWSKTQSKPYWFNNITKSTVWEKPSDYEEPKKENNEIVDTRKRTREEVSSRNYKQKSTEWKFMNGDLRYWQEKII